MISSQGQGIRIMNLNVSVMTEKRLGIEVPRLSFLYLGSPREQRRLFCLADSLIHHALLHKKEVFLM